jgi:glycosyltransferase involved in cell wall biosynthesis
MTALSKGPPREVLLLGTYVMPDKTPAALRALGLAAALREAGYRCSFGAGEVWEEEGWRPEGYACLVDGFPVVSLAELGGPATSRWRRAAAGLFLAGRGARKWLESRDLSGVSAVIANGGYTPLMLRLLPLLRSRGVPLVVDIADWYDPWHLPGGPLGPYCWQVELAMRRLHKKCDGVITVSSFLERYYQAPERPTVRIPPTTDTNLEKWRAALDAPREEGEDLRLVYAGAPGKKDDLRMVLEAMRLVRHRTGPVRLTVIGPSVEAVRQALPEDLRGDLDTQVVRFTGRVEHEAVPRLLAEGDFSVLMRPRERYAQAGFPTKLVESMCAGVPPIVNATSDIPEYVHDGVEGLLVPEYSKEALAAALLRAAGMTVDQRLRMRLGTRKQAETAFESVAYAARMDAFLAEVQAAAMRRRAA